jgi:acyl-coenzyme A synthetase/AMP-(fatty) acid ligase
MPCYGLTEASPRVTYLPSHRLTTKPDSIGIPISGVHVGIYRDGQQVSIGEYGEIIVNGPNVMLGYYNDVQRTADFLKEYGLRTSDMGYMDEEGYIYVTGRLDHALNVAGHTLYPEMLEKILIYHPQVREAAVVGMTDEIYGQRPMAFVVWDGLIKDEQKSMDELHHYCRDHLSAIHYLKEICFVQQLPMTINGKLDRSALHSMVKERKYCRQ